MPANRQKVGAALCAIAGALLVVSLFLDWWGKPPVLINPPADAPKDILDLADLNRDTAFNPIDAFQFYGLRDVLWVIAGTVGLLYGVGRLGWPRIARPFAIVAGVLAVAALVLTIATLIAPPDFYKESYEAVHMRLPFQYDVPVGREIGPWVALLASLGITVGVLLAVRGTD